MSDKITEFIKNSISKRKKVEEGSRKRAELRTRKDHRSAEPASAGSETKLPSAEPESAGSETKQSSADAVTRIRAAFTGLSSDSRLPIRAILAGYIAAFIFVLFAFAIGPVEETETADEKAVEESVSRPNFTYSRPASRLKDISGEQEETFTPAPDKLNLAYFFPEGADTSDSINSYAGRIFTELNTENAEFFASYFDLTDSTPLSIASRYGLGSDRVMGKYNPQDSSHDPDNSSTWTVNSFRNINVSFYDGDGSRISGYYDVQEIMALASVYAYYHEMDDYEAMAEYCRVLFGNAVSAKVSLGSVYYDSGCLNRTVEQEMNEAIAMENEQAQIEGGSSYSISSEPGELYSEQSSESESPTHDYAVANRDLSVTVPAKDDGSESTTDIYTEQSSAVVYYDRTTAEEKNSSSTDSSTAESTSSGTVVAGSGAGSGLNGTAAASDQDSWRRMDENVVVSPGSDAATSGSSSESSSSGSTDSGSSDTQSSSDGSAELSDTPAVVGDAGSAQTGSAAAYIADASYGAVSYVNGGAGDSAESQDSQGNADGSAGEISGSIGSVTYTDGSNASETEAEADSETDTDSSGSAVAVTGVFLNGAVSADDISDNVVVSPANGSSSGSEASAAVSDLPPESGESADTTGQSHADGSLAGTDSTASGNTSGNTDTTDTETDSEEGSTYTVTESYCPGHIDLYVSITIRGIDNNNSLFKADTIGNNEENFNDEWQGWTEDKIALARALYEQDWLENYGLSISSIRITDSLTEEEITGYINSLSPDISDDRKAIVRYALESVGKVPYYWGGKPSGPGYDSNNFYRLISPDYRGRILKGLDCSGWINWVYWSVTGRSLAGQSTGTLIGCGRKIQRADLKPGDIIIRTGADAHVVMFLCWAQNGNFIGIHETGGVINNVVVSEMTASWPYYRSLID